MALDTTIALSEVLNGTVIGTIVIGLIWLRGQIQGYLRKGFDAAKDEVLAKVDEVEKKVDKINGSVARNTEAIGALTARDQELEVRLARLEGRKEAESELLGLIAKKDNPA